MSDEPKFELVSRGKNLYKIKRKGMPDYVGQVLPNKHKGRYYASLTQPLDISELEEIVREMKNL